MSYPFFEIKPGFIKKNMLSLGILIFLLHSEFAAGQEKPFSTQMHIHGHSHHNGVPKPGSMQWHSYFAKKTGTDIIWWTDHQGAYNQKFDFIIKLEKGILDSATLNITGMPGFSILPVKLLAVLSGGIPTCKLESGILEMNLSDSSTGSGLNKFLYYPRSSSFKITGFILPRPISSKAFLEFDLDSKSSTDQGHFIELGVILSWHYYGGEKLQNLVYRFGTTDTLYRHLSDDTLFIERPISEGFQHISLNLLEDASFLENGNDNVITDLYFGLRSASNQAVTAAFSNFKIISHDSLPEHQLQKVIEYAEKYGSEYGHTQIVGIEFSPYNQNNPQPHLNAFLPTGNISSYLIMEDSVTINSPGEFIKRIHNNSGIVSFNHLFGTESKAAGLDPDSLRLARRESTFNSLRQNKVYGADILEVGYELRGKMNLRDHLATWDKLLADGVLIYGNGVSDSHGDAWTETMVPGSFVTWIWSENSDPDNLIKAAKMGRMYFGNNFRFNGKFDFKVDSFSMGAITKIKDGQVLLKINADSFPAGSKIFLYQAKIKPGKIEYIHEKTELQGLEFPVNVSSPCFIRIEVFQDDTIPVIFSNPVFFIESLMVGQIKENISLNVFPNPSNKGFYIPLKLLDSQWTEFSIHDALGRLVKTIDLGYLTPGFYIDSNSFFFDGRDHNGKPLKEGVYFLKIKGEYFTRTQKLIIH